MRPIEDPIEAVQLIDKLLSQQPAGYVNKPQLEQKLEVYKLNHGICKAAFPSGIEITQSFLQELDHSISKLTTTPCKLLIEINGVDGFTEGSKRYVVSKTHIQNYTSVAFVKNTVGDMSVLETHYLQQFVQFTQIPGHYTKRFFNSEKPALEWLQMQS